MTTSELTIKLVKHKKWLEGCAGGERADLQDENLRYADLRGIDLRNAYLEGTDMRCAYLQGADLRGAYLHGADLRGADLLGADLREADLRGAYLQGAKNIPFIPMICPEEGEFIGWKKAFNGKQEVIVKLLVTGRRSSATSRKCRCEKAIVIAIESIDGATLYDTARSKFDSAFIYTVGKEIRPRKLFCNDRWNECSSGIHFFVNRQEAVEYKF